MTSAAPDASPSPEPTATTIIPSAPSSSPSSAPSSPQSTTIITAVAPTTDEASDIHDVALATSPSPGSPSSVLSSTTDPDTSVDEPSLIPLQGYRAEPRPSTLRHRRLPTQHKAGDTPAARTSTYAHTSVTQGATGTGRDRDRDRDRDLGALPSEAAAEVPSVTAASYARLGLAAILWSSQSTTPTADAQHDPTEQASAFDAELDWTSTLSRLRSPQTLTSHRPTMTTSHFVSWAAKHKRVVALAFVALFLYLQVQFVAPYVGQLDLYRRLKDADWQWPFFHPDRLTPTALSGSSPNDGAAAGPLAPPSGNGGPAQSLQQNSSAAELGAAVHFNLQAITPAAFPAAVDSSAYGGGAKASDHWYKDADPHRGELPTHLRIMLEKEPLLAHLAWPPKAPEITDEVWPRRSWEDRSQTTLKDANRPESQPLEEDWREKPWDGWRPPLDNFTASAAASPLPKVQFDFEDPTRHSGRRNDPARDELIGYRQRLVRNAFLHAWEGYKRHAWGHDELRPVSKRAQDNFNGWGATIVDALDTLLVMDLPDQYDLARQHVHDIDFTLVGGDRSAYGAADGRLPVFETAIRYLGGFLSAYDLSGDTLMRDRAEELAQLISPAFETATGVPVGRIKMASHVPLASSSSSPSSPSFATGQDKRPFAPPHSQGSVVLAEAGSLLLEFTRLWQVTGNRTYFDRVQRSTDWLDRNMTRENRLGTLFPATLYPERQALYGTYRFGGMADSYYEYLIKEHQLLGGKLSQYPRMYSESIDSAKFFLMQEIETVPGVRMLNIGERTKGRFTSKLEHLTCFSGGMLGLGAKLLDGRRDDIDLAKAFTETCWWAYNSSATGLGPENLVFYASDDASRFELLSLKDGTQRRGKARGFPLVGVASSAGHYLNRPETIESVFYMWRITGDPQWQERGWQMFTSWVYHSMTDAGFSAVDDVHHIPADWTDSMESFTFAETFKYYYLLFSPPDLISLDEYVFTTEAHPLLAPTRDGKWAVPGQGRKRFRTPSNGEAAHRAAATLGIYPGGEGGPYGGLTNNQKHIAHRMWQEKNGKVVVARNLIENLGAEVLRSTFKGLFGGVVDWEKLVGGGNQPAAGMLGDDEDDTTGAAMVSEAGDEDERALADHSGDDITPAMIMLPNGATIEWTPELLAGSQLVRYADGTIALELDEGSDAQRHFKVLAAAAANSESTDGPGAEGVGDVRITLQLQTQEALEPASPPQQLELSPEDKEAQEKQRWRQMQAARFRPKGLVAPVEEQQ